MKQFRYTLAILCLAVFFSSCNKEMGTGEARQLSLTTEILPFDGGETGTKVSLDGRQFETGDWIRFKIICPFSTQSQLGEYTSGDSFDAFYLLKYTGSTWTRLVADDHCDINGDYRDSNSPDPFSGYYAFEAQPTPYVFMANTWTEEKIFKSPQGVVNSFCHVFHSDQTTARDYKASDLLWAQQYMQTGTWNVHLSFRHVMSCLVFELDSDIPVGATAELSLVGMPDIDQQEVIVGDYYAAKEKIGSRYGYRQKNFCSIENNGKVIGIGINNFTSGRAETVAISTFPLGTYRAYHVPDSRTYKVIVPPCVLENYPVVWIRDGEKRYCVELGQKTFEQGVQYNIPLKLKTIE